MLRHLLIHWDELCCNFVYINSIITAFWHPTLQGSYLLFVSSSYPAVERHLRNTHWLDTWFPNHFDLTRKWQSVDNTPATLSRAEWLECDECDTVAKRRQTLFCCICPALPVTHSFKFTDTVGRIGQHNLMAHIRGLRWLPALVCSPRVLALQSKRTHTVTIVNVHIILHSAFNSTAGWQGYMVCVS